MICEGTQGEERSPDIDRQMVDGSRDKLRHWSTFNFRLPLAVQKLHSPLPCQLKELVLQILQWQVTIKKSASVARLSLRMASILNLSSHELIQRGLENGFADVVWITTIGRELLHVLKVFPHHSCMSQLSRAVAVTGQIAPARVDATA